MCGFSGSEVSGGEDMAGREKGSGQGDGPVARLTGAHEDEAQGEAAADHEQECRE